MYHLKEDGTAGLCKAKPGNCPLGNAIHGTTVEDVYTALATKMEALPLGGKQFPVTPRQSVEAVGVEGAMMHYKNPQLIKHQVEALESLGLHEPLMEILQRNRPSLAEQVGNREEIDYSAHEEKPVRYTYGEYETEYGHGWSEGEHYTWVGKTHYELQTLALYTLMDRLEKGTMKGVDLKSYFRALGSVGKLADTAHLAFNYNPHRQPDEFWNGVKNRLIKEDLREEDLGNGKKFIHVPSFLWEGLDENAKERLASSLIHERFKPRAYTNNNGKWVDNYLNSRDGVRETLSNLFAHHPTLHRYNRHQNETVTADMGDLLSDASYPKVKYSYTLTDSGIELTTLEQFYSYQERGWHDRRNKKNPQSRY